MRNRVLKTREEEREGGREGGREEGGGWGDALIRGGKDGWICFPITLDQFL